MNVKKVQLFLCMIVSVLIFLVGYKAVSPISEEEKMENMIAVIERNGAAFERWSWLAKETKTISNIHTFEQLVQNIGKRADVEKWEFEQSKEGYKAVAKRSFSSHEERIVVTWMTENNKENTFIIYEVSGKRWNPKYIKKMDKIFSTEPTIYTCIEGTLNDKIEGVLQNKAKGILEDLSARAIEQVEERAFVSISAYNEKWDDALSKNREKINVQIAVRSTDKKNTIVVGTPIITSEY
ncbi:YwmB family TATA-box binding protein [Bacillus manliponensis]|uniref:YwmB family TATA-box binding protein n=1 Tax=Bacillus manliponensis TaxID=574376 RepID=UPI00351847AD